MLVTESEDSENARCTENLNGRCVGKEVGKVPKLRQSLLSIDHLAFYSLELKDLLKALEL